MENLNFNNAHQPTLFHVYYLPYMLFISKFQKDPARALRMTTRQTLMEVWRDGGMRGLFTGVGPRVGRAGPSVGIVISFYEVVKYVLRHQYSTS